VLENVCLVYKPTVVLVTHDLREAVYLADRVLVMSARPGRIIAERAVPFERPRRREDTLSPAFSAMVQELRDLIDIARHSTAGVPEHVS
jgi:NitT/TauT family transport system ATP-binding protein